MSFWTGKAHHRAKKCPKCFLCLGEGGRSICTASYRRQVNRRRAIQSRLFQSLCGSRSVYPLTIECPLIARTDASEGRDEEFELYEFEHYVTAKYLRFPIECWIAAYGYVNFPRFFVFCAQRHPLYAIESAMERKGKSLFPSRLRLTQSTANITTPTMMYKASTFRLRSYKAYMRMIKIPISRGKYIYIINIVSKIFGKNKRTSDDHLNNDD